MKTAIIINNESLGKGNESLGNQLMGAFFRKLWASSDKPDVIMFYNSGVKLLAKGSGILEVFHGLYEQGVELIACGTCIDHYDLKDSIEVGRRTDMTEIVDTMMKAEKVITV